MPLAFYRKYRPRSFDDLLGQEQVVEILKNAAKSDRLAHAYVFYGPRGTGKTTVARLVAKLANCLTRQEDKNFHKKGQPCNKCSHCEEIDTGRALDVVEIDAASNRGIDEIRSLKESARLSPTSYSHKVYIIDEAHQLTKEAFNALLKTLEEPPPHVIFILATTEFEKLPATITSRAQRFHFKKLPIEQIVKKLKTIAAAEDLTVANDALELIASIAEGSVRDAESLLDQLTSLKEEVDVESVEKILGKVGFARTAELADMILAANLAGALQYVHRANEEGYNIVDLNKELIHYLRRVLSLKFDPGLESLFKHELTSHELDQLKKHAQLADGVKHIALLKSLIRAYSEMRYSPFAIVPLEVALIENLSQS